MFAQYFQTLSGPLHQFVQLYRDWWYLITPILLSIVSIDAWRVYSKEKFWKELDYDLIAINVPPELEKSPKFMDQFFAVIFGIQSVGSWSDKFWRGRQQLFLSLEIVGIGGMVKLIIRVPRSMRDYIEASLYATYPEAEIEEVEDYTHILDWQTIDKEYSFFGSELQPTTDDPYPIRTYEEFEDEAAGIMMDPVAAIAEICTSLVPGECAWIQILASASENKTYKNVLKIVDKAMKRKEEEASMFPKIPLVKEFLDLGQHVISKGPATLLGLESEDGHKKELHTPDELEFPAFSPGERAVLEALEENSSKLGYDTKIRLLYAAPKDKARQDSIVSSLFGIFWQIAALDKRGLKPHKRYWTKIDYFFPKYRSRYRKRRIWERYVKRDFINGGKSFVMSTAELATIFHPYSGAVKAPYLERIESRKAEPPHNLPVV
jgi:hypothetical protein